MILLISLLVWSAFKHLNLRNLRNHVTIYFILLNRHVDFCMPDKDDKQYPASVVSWEENLFPQKSSFQVILHFLKSFLLYQMEIGWWHSSSFSESERTFIREKNDKWYHCQCSDKNGSKTEMRSEKSAFYEFLLSFIYPSLDKFLIVHFQSIIAITTGKRVRYYLMPVLDILKAFN